MFAPEWKRQSIKAVEEFHFRCLRSGKQLLRPLEMAQKLMRERGFVIICYGPGSAFPASGETTDIFGGARLPKGARLRVVSRTTPRALAAQIAHAWDAQMANDYPTTAGIRYYRCVLEDAAQTAEESDLERARG